MKFIKNLFAVVREWPEARIKIYYQEGVIHGLEHRIMELEKTVNQLAEIHLHNEKSDG